MRYLKLRQLMPGRLYLTKSPGPPPRAISVAVSNAMRSNRASGTLPELILSKALDKTLARADLPGRPDFVYPREKLAVFVHGCFWHRCPECKSPFPRSHRSYWLKKLKRNVERDSIVRQELEEMGWEVLVVWEHRVKENPRRAALQVWTALGKL